MNAIDVSLQDLLYNQYLDKSSMATSSSSVQRSPQFVVLSIDTGSSVQQDLHHVLVVVNTTLEKKENNINPYLCGMHNTIKWKKRIDKE